MKMSDNALGVAAVVSSIITLALGAPSAWWLDHVIGAHLRGTQFEWLIFASILLVVAGSGYIWWRVFTWIVGIFEGNDK